MSSEHLWERFKTYFLNVPEIAFSMDSSRMNFPDTFFTSMEKEVETAFAKMRDLEGGAVANPSEQRMVGHYWLRNSGLAPTADLRNQIDTTLSRIKEFSKSVHNGTVASVSGDRFRHLLVIGIGGSALGPQFVNNALKTSCDKMDAWFFDNTDPDGMVKVLGSIPDLSKTLCVVISKSGGTKETRNGMLVAQAAWKVAGLDFAKSAVAVTGNGSELDKTAAKEGWIARFPMWDWVGGRTSETSAVGLLPAALQGFNVDELLRGAREMDEVTRHKQTAKNPAMQMALMWHFAGQGKGTREMVVLPYNDRLELFSRYLQQLVMESLGKEKDNQERIVHQGLSVYGNKGSTDQHAFVQQLRDGLSNFFVVFVEVMKDISGKSLQETTSGGLPRNFAAHTLEVEPGITCGDYLSGFYQGTRRALYESGRQSITITTKEVNEYAVGQLIALFERAVGYYAALININAYDQPGVEAGKKAAGKVISLQTKVMDCLRRASSQLTVEQVARNTGEQEQIETVFKVLRRLSENGRVKTSAGAGIFEDKYSI